MNSELTENTDIKEPESPDCADGLVTGPPRADVFRGWILYDGACRSCAVSARRFERIFRRRGFLFLPLQTNWVIKRRGLEEDGVPVEEIRVLTADDRDIGGADAMIFLARQIWWARPFAALARLPGLHELLDQGYRWIAAHRGCDHITCNLPSRRRWPGSIGLIVLPLLTLLARNRLPPWQFMWLISGAIFLGCKWLTFSHTRKQSVHVPVGHALAYFFLWPGMDAEKFLRRHASEVHKIREQGLVAGAGEELSGSVLDTARRLRPRAANSSERLRELPIACAIGKMLLGVVLLFAVARFAPQPLLAGWIGMIGIILILHFGLFDLLAIGWRIAGRDAEPIMDAPLCSKTVSEFWGRRWNGAFNQLALGFVFRPVARRRGTRIATLAAFLVSGLIHEVVISLPAGADYGLPTAYFFLQGIGILTERALTQIRGQIFTIVITAVPMFWLFHPPFVRNVILPFMKALGAL